MAGVPFILSILRLNLLRSSPKTNNLADGSGPEDSQAPAATMRPYS